MAQSYLRPRPAGAFLLGISSGFPLTLLTWTMSYWLAKVGVDKTTIGFAFALGTPYTLKFLWAPIIDGVSIPLLTRLVGQRRAWLWTIQALLAFSVVELGMSDPVRHIARFALWGTILAFLSATQDIVIDAYRIEILNDSELAQGTATNQIGYRTGDLLAGAGTIYLASQEGAGLGWAMAYGISAMLVVPGTIASLWLGPGKSVDEGIERRQRTPPRGVIVRSVIEPFRDFLKRPGAWLILLFILTYKVGDAMGQNMLAPMIVHEGFSDTEYIAINKLVRFWCLVGGSVLAGGLIARFGMARLLLGAGVMMIVANLLFGALASVGHSLPLLTLAVATENLFGAISLTVFATYLSALCNTPYTATQYALLSSVAAIARTFLTTPSGVVADRLGFGRYYVFCAMLAVPSLLLLSFLRSSGLIAEIVRQSHLGAMEIPALPDERSLDQAGT